MRRIVSIVVVAGLIGAGVWAYFYSFSGGNAPRYRFARVERGPLTAAVSATGNLNAVITVQVGSQVSGQIKELLADFNSIVQKGQVIARIDPEIFEAKVGQARADLDSARATVLNQQAQVERARADVENARAAHAEARAQTAKANVAVLDARRDFARKTELLSRELIAKSDHDTAQAALDSAQAQLDASRAKEQSLAAAIRSAEAQLRVAEAMLQSARAQVAQKQAALQQALIDLEHTTIRAPVDGVVVSRAVDVGQTVAASLQAPVLFTIAQDLTKMQVETSVDEADIGRIKLGDRATFTIDAFPGERFTGEVVQIRKAALVVQNVVTYTVVVAVSNPGGRLLPGMTANVKLVVAEKSSVVKVPNSALRFRPAGTDARPGGSVPVGSSPAAGGGGGERQSLESIRERLVRSLGLTEEQQRKLDPILEESRQQFRALQGTTLSEAERRARGQRIREAARVRIRELLTPEQRARYDELAGAGGGERPGTPGRVWIAGPDGKPKAVALTLGISDGTSTEVLQGEVGEGQELIVGIAGGAPAGPGGGTTGPRLRL
ncbi:MAG: efflux RND transporter periplasmic adaptor subunit [Candidatus Rokubacteria bacterium]|nr:efflux RND transporter periplasmic adaptor subunit [Candidatus Rokubacteria bacterium]